MDFIHKMSMEKTLPESLESVLTDATPLASTSMSTKSLEPVTKTNLLSLTKEEIN
jgi:hypothetical protein